MKKLLTPEKIKELVLIALVTCCRFINRDDVDFTLASELPPMQEFEVR